MTSANSLPPASRRKCSGFTLLEIIIVLAIIAVLSTFFTVRFVEASEDDDLRIAASELRMAAQKANRLAEAHGGDFYLMLDRRGFGLGENAGVGDFGEATYEHALPKGIRLKVRRFGDEGWSNPDNFPWGFPASGLCEPIDVRLEKGRAYVELSFNALTGRVDEEQSWYP